MSPKEISNTIINELQTVYEVGEARSISRLLMEELFGLNTSDLVLNKEMDLGFEKEKQLKKIIERLLSLEPIQHVLGFAWFMGDRYKISEEVLIPRQETEELVDLIVRENNVESPMILDVGTGSGCIPVALKKLILGAEVHATEVSSTALVIALDNARSLESSVIFYQSDILKEFPPISGLDVIVSNPPYVTESEKEEMNWNVLNHEPELALFVSNEDPLLFYRIITQWAYEKLNKGGKLYFEINEALGQECVALVEKNGLKRVRLIQDLNGKDRIVAAIR